MNGEASLLLSVIIPGFGNGRATAEAMSVRLRAALGELAEVIVADGANVAEARENGLTLAKGDYVAWVDADDRVEESWAGIVMDIAKTGTYDIVHFDFKVEEGGVVSEGWNQGGEAATPAEFLSDLLGDERQCSQLWNKVSRRSLWRGVHFPEGAVAFEDYAVIPHVVARARSVGYVHASPYVYIITPMSLCHRVSPQYYRLAFDAALRRVGEWTGTPFASAAILGALRVHYSYYEYAVLGRVKDIQKDPAIMREARSFVRRHFAQILSDRRLWFSRRMKYVAFALGCEWLQPLWWKLTRSFQ